MADIPIVIVFGPSEDSFYVGAGRQFYLQNMPQSLTEKVQGTELPIGRVGWINVDRTGEQWCGENFLDDTIHYSVDADSELHQHIQSECAFVSFPEDTGSYFIKHQSQGRWNGNVEDIYLRTITQLREKMNDFDTGLKWILFGKGGTHIYQFETGFVLNYDGKHEDPAHPLRMAIKPFEEDNTQVWIVDKGSSMCLYDDRYYFLKFKKDNSGTMQLRYNLPPAMDQKLKELVELARTPEEQQALFLDQTNMITQIARSVLFLFTSLPRLIYIFTQNMKHQLRASALQAQMQINATALDSAALSLTSVFTPVRRWW